MRLNSHYKYTSLSKPGCALPNTQIGATLLEAVVALFVFAVGALGVAALQTTSMVRTDDTKQRTIALWKAQELTDRIRATRTVGAPEGLIADYVAAIGNDNSDDSIGSVDLNDVYACGNLNTRCDDQNGTDAGQCTSAELVASDIWTVFCDPLTGLFPAGAAIDGSVGLRDLEVALETDANESRLYLEWLSRSAEQNEDSSGTDTGQVGSATGVARTVSRSLCGVATNVDTRLEAYCVRF
ncbi:MAG: hypothetical protein AAF197_06655 [Pseudomonadota bacterium]